MFIVLTFSLLFFCFVCFILFYFCTACRSESPVFICVACNDLSRLTSWPTTTSHTPQRAVMMFTSTLKKLVSNSIMEIRNVVCSQQGSNWISPETLIATAFSAFFRYVCTHPADRGHLHLWHYHSHSPRLWCICQAQPAARVHSQGAQRQLHQCTKLCFALTGR